MLDLCLEDGKAWNATKLIAYHPILVTKKGMAETWSLRNVHQSSYVYLLGMKSWLEGNSRKEAIRWQLVAKNDGGGNEEEND